MNDVVLVVVLSLRVVVEGTDEVDGVSQVHLDHVVVVARLEPTAIKTRSSE